LFKFNDKIRNKYVFIKREFKPKGQNYGASECIHIGYLEPGIPSHKRHPLLTEGLHADGGYLR